MDSAVEMVRVSIVNLAGRVLLGPELLPRATRVHILRQRVHEIVASEMPSLYIALLWNTKELKDDDQLFADDTILTMFVKQRLLSPEKHENYMCCLRKHGSDPQIRASMMQALPIEALSDHAFVMELMGMFDWFWLALEYMDPVLRHKNKEVFFHAISLIHSASLAESWLQDDPDVLRVAAKMGSSRAFWSCPHSDKYWSLPAMTNNSLNFQIRALNIENSSVLHKHPSRPKSSVHCRDPFEQVKELAIAKSRLAKVRDAFQQAKALATAKARLAKLHSGCERRLAHACPRKPRVQRRKQ